MRTIFITGIDTDSGKTYATGLLGKYLHDRGTEVITQKLVQTGCKTEPEDLLVHRKIMGLTDQKLILKEQCPYCFSLPASPHLAAEQESVEIDPDVLTQATLRLEKHFKTVLLEGAGGLFVPLTRNLTIIDYLSQRKYPVILVTSAKLGSINHTLLSLEALKSRNLDILGLIYNKFPDHNPLIGRDSLKVFKTALKNHAYPEAAVELPVFSATNPPDIDFGPLFKTFQL